MSASYFISARSLSEQPAVLIYGAGNAGYDVYSVLTRHGGRVQCFLDQKAQPCSNIEGIPVRRPDTQELSADERALPVIIAVHNREVDIFEIAKHLASLGLGPCISFMDFYLVYPEEFGDRLWLTTPRYYDNFGSVLNRAESLYADELSREIFNGWLKLRLTGDCTAMPYPGIDHLKLEYFPSDIPNWPPHLPLRLIDCGAYDGDTLRYLRMKNIPVEAAACFEPDPANFAKLARLCRSRNNLMLEGEVAL